MYSHPHSVFPTLPPDLTIITDNKGQTSECWGANPKAKKVNERLLHMGSKSHFHTQTTSVKAMHSAPVSFQEDMCMCASADVLWRAYGCKTLLSGVYQHGEIISQGKLLVAAYLRLSLSCYQIWWWHFWIHRFLQSTVDWWAMIQIDRKVESLKASWGAGWLVLPNINGN